MTSIKISQVAAIVAIFYLFGTFLVLLFGESVKGPEFGIVFLASGFLLVISIRKLDFPFLSIEEKISQFMRDRRLYLSEERAAQDEITQKVQDLFDRLPIAMVHIDSAGCVSQTNSAARDFLCLEPGETPAFEVLVEGLGRSVSTWLQAAKDSDAVSKPEMVQVKRSKTEAILQVSLMAPPKKGQGGVIATLSDATELKSLEAQFVQSQKMQAIGQLAGGVAHDFNNLLTAISGYCDLLLLRHENGDQDYADLIQINQNANRAAALVGQLLAFSRKQTLTPQILAVNETLSELTHLLSRLLGEKVQLVAEYGKDLPSAFVDGRQLEQVIMNLVVNARDAMPDGGVVKITSSALLFEENRRIEGVIVPKGRYVTISVQDTGCGITDEHLEKIFEPFFSTKDVGDGTGLGLSMAYGIIKQTGGFIFADSEVGRGSNFTIYLPASDESAQIRDKPREITKSGLKSMNGLTVLLVEDEAPVRTFASRALGLQGVRVIEADSAEVALEKLKNSDLFVDVIISDVVMPGMDGPTWVMKARQQRPNVNVIFVSGYAEESFVAEFGEIENAVFLPKPFSLKQLIEKVRDLAA